MLIGVYGSEIESRWALIEPLVVKALERSGAINEYSPESIKDFLKSGDMQLWAWVTDRIVAIGITQIVIYPKRRILDVPFAAADKMTIEEWMDKAFTELMKFARLQGCSGIRGFGRRGWIKHFEKFGKVRHEAHFIVDLSDHVEI